jgi:hypothetical protein
VRRQARLFRLFTLLVHQKISQLLTILIDEIELVLRPGDDDRPLSAAQ